MARRAGPAATLPPGHVRRQRRPRGGVVDDRGVGLAGHRCVRGVPVGQRRRAEQDGGGQRSADEEQRHPPPRQQRQQHRKREQDQWLHADGGSGEPARERGPRPALREDGVQQQPDRHGVLGVTPARGHAPQDAGAGGDEQPALPAGHLELLGECVGGEQRHAAQRDLVGPGHQPDRRMQVVRAGDLQRQPGRRDDGGARDEDDRRAGQRDQAGRRRIDRAQVQVREPGRRDQRPPQVIGKRPLGPPHHRRAPGGRVHPDHDQQH